MLIKISELKNLVNKSLKNYDYDPKERKVISDILLYAQLRGNNQGVVKLIGKGIPKRAGAKSPKIVKETPVSALYNGNKTHAMIVYDLATNSAIKKAKTSGIGIAGNFGSTESTGALGYYVEKVAKNGLIGLAFASAPFQTTAPFGSNEARFCTNPIAWSFPTNGSPIIFDTTTSAMAYYGLIEAKTAGKTLPEGIGFDKDGNPTQNPAEIMSGALKTFAGHKGSGLALVGQIMAGALVSADSFDNNSDNAGNFIMAIDPKILTSTKKFKTEVSEIVKKIKSARKAPGVSEIFIPGEKGDKLKQQRLKSGMIDIEDNLLEGLRQAAK